MRVENALIKSSVVMFAHASVWLDLEWKCGLGCGLIDILVQLVEINQPIFQFPSPSRLNRPNPPNPTQIASIMSLSLYCKELHD